MSPPTWPRVLWPGVAALVAVMGVGRFAYTPILPEMLAEGRLTLVQAGWVASANFVGYLVGATAAAAVSDRARQTRLARAALAATLLALAAMAAADGLASWMAVRFVAGVASAFALVFVSVQVFERLAAIGHAQRSIELFAGVGVGIAASALLTIVAHAAGLASPWWWVGAAALAAPFAAVAWAGAVGHAPPPAAAGAASPGPAPRAPRAFAAAVASYGLFGLGYVIHATYLPAMVRQAGFPPAAAAWVWVLVGASIVAFTPMWQRIARRVGVRGAIVGCCCVQGATALVPMLSGSVVAAGVAAIGLGATLAPGTGLALAHARALDAGHPARAVGGMTAAFGVGQVAGPVVAAGLVERAGGGAGAYAGPSLLACAALLVAAALMVPRLDGPR